MLPFRIQSLIPRPAQLVPNPRQALLQVRYLASNPLASLRHRLRSTVLAGPGFLGYAGGVYNPGALAAAGSEVLVLCRAQVRHWLEARGPYHQDHLVGAPVLMRLDTNLEPTETRLVSILNEPLDPALAMEDFRLFSWDDGIGVNYNEVEAIRTPKRVGYKSSRVVLGRLNPDEGTLTRVTSPTVDFELQPAEKNWVFFQRGNELFAIYGLAPYRLLRSQDGGHSFHTVLLADGGIDLADVGGCGTRTSLSTNPIRFDSRHDLVLVHQIDPERMGRHYTQWPLLIDRRSLLPVSVGSRPVLRGFGARGQLRGALYASSLLARDADELVVFHGEGDSYASYSKLDRRHLEARWIQLAPRILRRVEP